MSELDVAPVTSGDATAVERTFLIADVRGYTRFTRERGDAEAARLARTFAGLARDAVEARSGRVIELRGDEALAVFATPAQAVRAAIELVALCEEEAAAQPDLPLLVGVGIDLGEAVPVEEGFRGAALNTAARLCSQAAAGQVLVTTTVAGNAVGVPRVRFEPRGTVELKGFEHPVDLIAAVPETAFPTAVTVTAAAEALPVELDVDTPIVARDGEVSWLRGTWRQARRGHGRLVVVSGPPGIGKSRLAAEIAAAAISQGAHVAYSGAGGTGAASAVSAVRDAVADPHPCLVVVDDLDALGEPVIGELGEQFDTIESTHTFVIALARDPTSTPGLTTLVARADRDGDGHRRLVPLGGEGVRAIAELYAPEDVDQMPLESIARSSGGVPGRLHEELSLWAEQEGSRRLAAAAEWLAEGTRRRNADLEFANTFIGLKLARLYEQEGPVLGEGAAACPYRGLASFEETDAQLFFGRERLVGELAARTVGSGVVAVVGASGSGKSSVIAAGLVPSLRAGLLPGSERWRSLSLRPGEHPSDELESALADRPAAERLVLVIDQFEEVFTTCGDQQERSVFVDRIVSLAEGPEQTVVVIAVRADFYGRCGDYPELARLLAANQILVGPMSREELRRAIELPARRAGIRVESALTDVLVAEIGEESGGLPLLSTGLVELWGTRSAGWLRLDAYERLGGVRAAVARLAESSYDQLAADQRDACRRLFLRLVTMGEEGVLTRRLAPVTELDLHRDDSLSFVVGRLTDDRLLTRHEDSVEVAHEALLREWPRFQEWLREDAQGRELREHLTQSARRWETQERSASDLYRGARLQSTLDWAAGRERELNELEGDFLAESRAENERELARQRRQNRRLKGLLAGAGVLLLAAIAAGAFALVQRADAQGKARVALARQLGAQAVSEPRLDRAMLLARESVNLDRSQATEGTLLATLLRSPAAVATFPFPITARPLKVAVSPDGRTLAVTDNSGTVRFFDTSTTRERAGRIEGIEPTLPIHYSRDGSLLMATGSTQGKFRFAAYVLYDTRTLRRVRTLKLDDVWQRVPTGSQAEALSPDGRVVAFAYSVLDENRDEGPAYLDRWIGSRLKRVPVGATGVIDVAFVDGGKTLMVASFDKISYWDAHTLRKLGAVPQPVTPSPFMIGAIDPQGRYLAIATGSGSVQVVDIAARRAGLTEPGHSAGVNSVSWAPDGSMFATTSDDGTVVLWDPATGKPLETFRGQGVRITSSAFDGSGETLYSAGLSGAVFKWDVGRRRRFGRPFREEVPRAGPLTPETPPLAVSPDGTRFAVRHGGSVHIFGTATLQPGARFTIDRERDATALAWSPRGRVIAVGAYDGPVHLWDVSAKPRRLRILRGLRSVNRQPEAVRGVAFSPDGSLVAATDRNNTPPGPRPYFGSIAVWRADTGAPVLRPHRLPAVASSLTFDPAGKYVAVGLEDGSVRVMRATDGRVERTLHPTGSPVTALAFAPDGTLMTGTWSGIAERWDVSSGKKLAGPVLVAPAPVASISFDHSGRVFATVGGSDGTVKLWTTSTLQQFGFDFPSVASTWGNARFTPDGRNLVVVFDNGRGVVWPATLRAWEDHACRVAGRNLTREEWSRFVSGRSYERVCPQFPGRRGARVGG